MASFALSGVIALALTWLPNRPAVVTLFAFALVVQPVLPRLVGAHNTAVAQTVIDFVIITVLVMLAPMLWAPSMVWVGATVAWQGIASPAKVNVPLLVLAATTASLSGWHAAVTYWWTAPIVIVVVGIALIVHGHQVRTEFREHEQDLMHTLAKAGAVVHHTSLDDSTVSRVIGDIEMLTGWTVDDWCRIDHRSIIHQEDVARYWIEADEAEDGMLLDRSWRMRRPDGRWVWIRDVSRVVVDRNGAKSLRGFSLDVTALEEANRTIAAQARIDILTGLPNRLALHERLGDELDGPTAFALMIIDLDRFKDVNDTLGHEAGDRLLAIVADRLSSALGPSDMLARLGGDEFAVLVANVRSASDVEPIVDRLTSMCSQPVSVNGVRVASSLSIGVAFNASEESDRATIMRHADIAMYAAKRSGQVCRFFDASLEQTSTVHLSLSATVPDAIAAGDIELYFQPKVDLDTLAIVGAEGLARWRHPEHGVLGPSTFLDVATMSDSASLFGRTMIEQGVQMAQRLAAAGRPLPIAVNITMRALHEPDFATWVLDTLERYEVASRLLVLELTEQEVRNPTTGVEGALRALGRAGVELAIDDFGTGHSSMQRLRELSVDELKIDHAFVDGIVDNQVDREIVGSIIALADRLRYRVVAEGVEHAEHARVLREMGCGVAQGFLFAPASPPDAFFEHVVDRDGRDFVGLLPARSPLSWDAAALIDG